MKKFFLYLMALAYAVAGINHFVHPETYLAIMPPWLPAHSLLVFLSGLAEVILAILLVPPTTRPVAAWGIILLLIAVLPANVQMLLHYWNESNPLRWLAIVRLPVQLLLVWWAYQYTGYLKIKL